MLASVSDLGYVLFVVVMFVFHSLKRCSFTFSFLTMVHILLARDDNISVKQSCKWFYVNGAYYFEPFGLL